MAPEQLEGREADERTDIWALGLVLYEMLTGRRAFDGTSSASIVAAILERDPPSLLSLRPSAPAPLDHVLRLCLAKDPDERWQSARDLQRELRWIPHQLDAEGKRSKRWTVRRVAAIVAAGIVAAMAAAAAARITLSIDVPPTTVARFVVPLPASDAVEVGLRPAITFAPDGSRFVYAAVRDGVSHLFLRRLDRIEPILLPGTEGAGGPFFSPDGQFVGFFASGKLMKMRRAAA